MRFVKLSEAELVTLQEGHKNGSQFQFRNRCQCLVLSSQGRTVSELAQFFEINPITIYSWFDRWESGGIADLMNRPGRGRKPILSLQNSAHIESVKIGHQEKRSKSQSDGCRTGNRFGNRAVG